MEDVSDVCQQFTFPYILCYDKVIDTGTWSMTLWYTSDLYAWDTTRFMATDNLYTDHDH